MLLQCFLVNMLATACTFAQNMIHNNPSMNACSMRCIKYFSYRSLRFKTKMSLIVFSCRLPLLAEIIRGGVGIEDHDLCFLDTIRWRDILNAENYEKNKWPISINITKSENFRCKFIGQDKCNSDIEPNYRHI